VTRSFLTIVCLFLLGTGTVLADTLWTRRYNGPDGGDEAVRAVLTDGYGNVVVVGSSPGWWVIGNDIVVLKYSPLGDTLWTRRFSGIDPSDDVAYAAALDAWGMISITGQTGQGDIYPDYDILTLVLNQNGSEYWRATYQGPSPGEGWGDCGTAIAVDGSGNVFVTGYRQSDTKDYVTLKYKWSGGAPVWTAVYDGGGDDKPAAIALGPDGSVYVTGTTGGPGADFLTVKYSGAGVEQWVACYNGPTHGPDWAVALAVDSSGSAYVAGTSRTSAAPEGINYWAAVKYDSAGAEQWVARYERDFSEPAALALGASALYVTGQTAGSSGEPDYATIAYDIETGDTLWVRCDSGSGAGRDVAVAVAVGPDRGVWVTGSGNYDFATVLYSSDGVREWVGSNSLSVGDDRAEAIAIDNENKVIVTGITWVDSAYDIVTVKFDTLTLAVAESPGREPISDFRFSVAPNPSGSGFASLRFGPASRAAASVTVFGADGRALLTRSLQTCGVNGTYPLDLSKLGAGVYVVRLQSGGRSATQKLVVGQ